MVMSNDMDFLDNDEGTDDGVRQAKRRGVLGRRKIRQEPTGGRLRKRLKLEPTLFKDNSISVGGQVKAVGEVLKKQQQLNGGRQPSINCRVEGFGRICQNFDPLRRRWVKEMGFEGLMHLLGNHLPRTFCYWLMTRLDPSKHLFLSTDGHEFRVTKNQVRWVLGIPNGSQKVPTKATSSELQNKVSTLLHKYGKENVIKNRKTRRVTKSLRIHVNNELMKRLEGEWVEGQECDFKEIFLIISLDMVLCPTQCPLLGADMIPPLTCALEANKYDWCDLVLKNLMENGRAFAERFYANGFSGGCGGCTMFLTIYYLDRLDRNPVGWGVYPRIKVWTAEEISKAKAEDRDDHTGDYGKLGCVDVTYGGTHPWEGKDSNGPISLADDAVRLVVEGVAREIHRTGVVDEEQGMDWNYVLNHASRKPRRGATSDKHPQMRRMEKGLREVTNQDGTEDSSIKNNDLNKGLIHGGPTVEESSDVYSELASRAGEASKSSQARPSVGNQPVDHFIFEDRSWEGTRVTSAVPLKMPSPVDQNLRDVHQTEDPSSSKAGGGSPCSPCDENLIVDSLELESPTFALVVFHSGGKLRQTEAVEKSRERRQLDATALYYDGIMSILKKKHPGFKNALVQYIRQNSQKRSRTKRPNPIILKCIGEDVKMNVCLNVISEREGLSTEYVRMASVLYTAAWGRIYGNRSRRYMLDPAFAIQVQRLASTDFKSRSLDRIVNSYSRPLRGNTINRVSEVFVPVLEKIVSTSFHWWCVIFSVNRSELRVIDSMSTDPISAHDCILQKLVDAIDCMFNAVDTSLVTGRIREWQWTSQQMTQQPDITSCGIFMLHAIKQCAFRFVKYLKLPDPVVDIRAWLLVDDVLLPENEALDDVKEVIGYVKKSAKDKD